jgi:hypothetical protein
MKPVAHHKGEEISDDKLRESMRFPVIFWHCLWKQNCAFVSTSGRSILRVV